MHALLRTAASPRGLAVLTAIFLTLPAVQAHSSDYTTNSSTAPTTQSAPSADPTAQNQGTPATPSTPTAQDPSTTPTTTPDASTSTTDDGTKKLPKTASEQPLLLLLGCVALAGAGITSYVRRMRNA